MKQKNENLSMQHASADHGSRGRNLLFERAQAVRLQKGPEPDETTVEARMAVVIQDFARPLLDAVYEQGFFEESIAVAVIAWNLALVREIWPEATLEELLEDTLGATASGEDGEGFREQVALLMRRKQRYFSQHRRCIEDYEITELRGRMLLTVRSAAI